MFFEDKETGQNKKVLIVFKLLMILVPFLYPFLVLQGLKYFEPKVLAFALFGAGLIYLFAYFFTNLKFKTKVPLQNPGALVTVFFWPLQSIFLMKLFFSSSIRF